jgi:hypothetical protein
MSRNWNPGKLEYWKTAASLIQIIAAIAALKQFKNIGTKDENAVALALIHHSTIPLFHSLKMQ